MLFVDQEKPEAREATEAERGDCLRAVTASFLELPLSEVPHFLEEAPKGEWFAHWAAWLRGRGVTLVPLAVESPPDIILFATGRTQDAVDKGQDRFHAVIMRGNTLVHDPHPLRKGLAEIARLYAPFKSSI